MLSSPISASRIAKTPNSAVTAIARLVSKNAYKTFVIAGFVTALTLTPAPFQRAEAQQVSESVLQSVATRMLNSVQRRSQRENREYCGYIGIDPAGQVRASRVYQGDTDGCTADAPLSWRLVANWHSHAGYDSEALSEIPSSDDLIADIEEGIIGYIGTPGGRLWRSANGRAQLIGRRGTLISDPRYRPDGFQPKTSYSLRQLRRLESAY